MSLLLRRKDGTANKLPLQIEISDDGPGIPPEIANDIFEPFVSGRENGTGLGLALVSKIISDHDGWITVDSVPGRTTFRISLPMAPKGAVTMEREEPMDGTVLVADDDRTIRTVLTQALTRAGCKVHAT